MKTGEACALCGANRKLERSHIIPQFVYRRVQATAVKNEKIDGPARPMLCGRCEDLFSAYESEFARHVFHPLAANATLSAKYGAWLRKFAASVCWRIQEDHLAENPSVDSVGRWTLELASCRETWRLYLTGKRPDVGGHHLHLLPLNAVLGGVGAGSGAVPREFVGPALVAAPDLSPHRIRMEVVCSDHTAFVYAQLGPVILIGLIADPSPKSWQGTRINAEGKLKPRDVGIPAPYLDFMISGPRSS